MQVPFAIISARSERQAMEWSLVLASQGIEAVVQREETAPAWQLIVPAIDYARAYEAIRLYRVENRRSGWQKELVWSELVFDARSFLVVAVWVALFLWQQHAGAPLESAAVMDNTAVRSGEWWRLFTAVGLHNDWSHLAANATTGLLLLGLAMGSFGAGAALLLTVLAGAGGNLAGLLVYAEPHRGWGASGMIMGALGLLTAQSLALWRGGWRGWRVLLPAIASGALLFILLGLSPEPRVDVVAHLGGFGSGAALGTIFSLLPARWTRQAWTGRAAAAACIALVLLAWWLALR